MVARFRDHFLVSQKNINRLFRCASKRSSIQAGPRQMPSPGRITVLLTALARNKSCISFLRRSTWSVVSLPFLRLRSESRCLGSGGATLSASKVGKST
jgi:hypothetical protein